jgi:hypothetical protein
MKKLGFLALLLGVLGAAVIGCEPAKKKTETKSTESKVEAPAGGAAPTTETTTTETKTEEKPADAPK